MAPTNLLMRRHNQDLDASCVGWGSQHWGWHRRCGVRAKCRGPIARCLLWIPTCNLLCDPGQSSSDIFWPCHVACRILVPQPGMEPMASAAEAQSFNHWMARETPQATFSISLCLIIPMHCCDHPISYGLSVHLDQCLALKCSVSITIF